MVNLSSKLGRQTSPLDWSDIIRDNFGSLCCVWLGLVTLLENPPTISLLDCRLTSPVLRSLLDCLLMTPLRSLLDVLLVIFLAGTGTLTDILLCPCWQEIPFFLSADSFPEEPSSSISMLNVRHFCLEFFFRSGFLMTTSPPVLDCPDLADGERPPSI